MSLNLWEATLQRVRDQLTVIAAASNLQVPGLDGDWYDVGEAHPGSGSPGKVNEAIWRQQQWQQAFEVLFVNLPKSLQKAAQQDDLLFFVPLGAAQGAKGHQPFVRRRTATLPQDLQPHTPGSAQVDWYQSVLLNLVMQTSFELCTAACRHEEIPQLPGLAELDSDKDMPPLGSDRQAVTKRVYASTTFTPMQQVGGAEKQRRDAQPVHTYPDLSFAIEDFEDAFESLVLKEAGWVYFVMLTATGGLALTSTPSQPFDSAAAQPGLSIRPSVPAAAAPPHESASGMHPQHSETRQAGNLKHMAGQEQAEEEEVQPDFSRILSDNASAQPQDPSHPLATGDWQSPSIAESPATQRQPSGNLLDEAGAQSWNGRRPELSAEQMQSSLPAQGQAERSAFAGASASASVSEPASANADDAEGDAGFQHRSSSSLLSARPIFADSSSQMHWPASPQQPQLQAQPPQQQPNGMHDGHPLAELFRHPLQSPRTPADAAMLAGQSSSLPGQTVQPPQTKASAPAAEAAQGRVMLYSGQVEFEALLAACKSGLWGMPSDPEVKLKMRLPRGKGGGDLLVTRMPRPKDEGHLTLQPAQTHKQPLPAGRGTFIGRKWASAKEALQNVAQALDPPVQMRCALLHLELPVELLVAKILRLPLKDQF